MLKVGIFFGGNSREREVSFAGGRTVYDNLDKSLFKPVPIFVDSWGNFCLLDWQYIYKGSIRDFYPPIREKESSQTFQIYAESLGALSSKQQKDLLKKLGTPIPPEDLKNYIDLAFLALHGKFAEDGTIQGMLDWLSIPYTGCGILPSSLGINKVAQKSLQQKMGFETPSFLTIPREKWLQENPNFWLSEIKEKVGFPCVIKSSTQGSSIGVTVLHHEDLNDFRKAVDQSFFILHIPREEWLPLHESEKIQRIKSLIDIREGLGLPVKVNDTWIYSPTELIKLLDRKLRTHHEVLLQGADQESVILVEQFIKGREFSCIVIQDEDGSPIAMPPTEIVKNNQVYDYRAKYLPGLSRKITPMDASAKQIQGIRQECCRLFIAFFCHVYARIDGFLSDDGKIYLNDPNTTSGMMPSSFFFHQAAEIGLEPSLFLTYIIRTSLIARKKDSPRGKHAEDLLYLLDRLMKENREVESSKIRVAVIMGGYSSERHISVESGRNVYEKLSSSTIYAPFPVFLTGDATEFKLFSIPVSMMLKDNADDIREKVLHPKENQILQKIRKEFDRIVMRYAKHAVQFQAFSLPISDLKYAADAVFIALHGRPGEDGTLQMALEKLHLPYNGSGPESSAITINKYETNNRLREAGFPVADSMLVNLGSWEKESSAIKKLVQVRLGYPLIAKPVDDGCSSAVCVIHQETELDAYAQCIFRKTADLPSKACQILNISEREEFSQKSEFLLEQMIQRNEALHFMEITGGFMTHFNGDEIEYEMFEPSETLASKAILSLEEKFLAGQGQNITPPRYASDKAIKKKIGKQVKQQLKAVARHIGVTGYARIDAFVHIDEDNQATVRVIEINSLPGMTPATAIFHQCALNGYKPFDFIHGLLQFGFERANKNHSS